MTGGAGRDRLGRIGIWSMELRFGDPAMAAEATAELDALGFGALWVPGGVGGEVFADLDRLLAASRRATIATGIVNIWKHEPAEIGAWWRALGEDHRARLLLGLGISHAPLIGDGWKRPVATMCDYLDRLAAEDVPADRLCLAALGPKMIELSRDRTAGAHPYLVTPEHTAEARAILGADALLAPEQGVVLETEPGRARAICRGVIEHYRRLPNYRNSWQRLGFSEAEIDDGCDRLVDALFAWGDEATVAARIDEHVAAGADHVCLQLVTGAERPDVAAALPGWRRLATLIDPPARTDPLHADPVHADPAALFDQMPSTQAARE